MDKKVDPKPDPLALLNGFTASDSTLTTAPVAQDDDQFSPNQFKAELNGKLAELEDMLKMAVPCDGNTETVPASCSRLSDPYINDHVSEKISRTEESSLLKSELGSKISNANNNNPKVDNGMINLSSDAIQLSKDLDPEENIERQTVSHIRIKQQVVEKSFTYNSKDDVIKDSAVASSDEQQNDLKSSSSSGNVSEKIEFFKLKSSKVSIPKSVEGLPSYLSQINFSPVATSALPGSSSYDLRDRGDSNCTESSASEKSTSIINVDSNGEICITSGDVMCRAVEKADFMNRKIAVAFGQPSSDNWKMSWIELRNEFLVVYKEDKGGRPGGNKQIVKKTKDIKASHGVLASLLSYKKGGTLGSGSRVGASRHGTQTRSSGLGGIGRGCALPENKDSSENGGEKECSVTSYMPYSKRPIGYVIHLSGCSVEPAYKITGRKYTFKITTSRNFEIIFGCSSLDVMADWIEAIQKRVEEVGECKENRLDETKSIFYSQRHSQKLVRKNNTMGKSGKLPNEDDMPFFGMNLMKYCSETGKPYPDFIGDGLKLIERNGLKLEGLYRICGNNHVINILKDKLNLDENVNLSNASSYDNDVNVICGLIKMYFRELSEPLLMFSSYSELISASDIPEEVDRIKRVKQIVDEHLTAPHRELLKILLKHLRRVHSHNSENKMPASNLALLFGPSILRPAEDDVQYFVNINKISAIVTLMILNHDSIIVDRTEE